MIEKIGIPDFAGGFPEKEINFQALKYEVMTIM